jgi:hypothetical protein
MKTTAKQTARETYETRQREIAAMLEFLKCELEGHADKARADGLHWGHVGDLGHIRENLKETLVFVMGGRDEEATGKMIEDAVADTLA